MYKVKVLYTAITSAQALHFQDQLNTYLKTLGERLIDINYMSDSRGGFVIIKYKEDEAD